MKKILFFYLILLVQFSSYAQPKKLDDTKYGMSIHPFCGFLNGNTNFTQSVNPNQNVLTNGFYYGLDWVNTRWKSVDKKMGVPLIQVPIKIKYLRSNDKNTTLTDGTILPFEDYSSIGEDPKSPYTFFSFGIDFYYSPFFIKVNNFIFTPKIGFGGDLGYHSYNVDLSKFIGKEGTNSGLQNYINDSYSPFINYTFWEDLYGFNIGAYLHITRYFMFDIGWEYYPIRLMTKFIGNTINMNYDAIPYTYKSSSSSLSRLNMSGQLIIRSGFSIFARWEYSGYKFAGPIIMGNEPFYQKYSNISLGITIGSPRF